MDVDETEPEPFAGGIVSGTTWSESTGAIDEIEKDEHQNEYDVDVEESSPHTRARQIVLDEWSSARPLRRTRSLDNITPENADEKSYMVSFRMPHPEFYNTNRVRTNNVASDARSDASTTDYNFVLDNYIEYADNTHIPRLRGKAERNKLLAAIHSSHWAVLCSIVTAGCFLTYAISNHSPFLRADLSQAIVITVVVATFPEIAASSGAGAFAGMASDVAIPNFAWLALLALATSGVWMLFHRFKILVGCGGRLGTCAFIAMNLTVAFVAMPSRTVPWSLYGDSNRLWSGRIELVPSILSVLSSTFLSAAAGAVRLKSEIPLNPVQAPTTMALVCMLILEPTGFVYTGQMDAGFAVGSFVAMASDHYLPSIPDFAGAGFISGLWILLLDPFFIDFGGKKGFTSFCGFTTYVGIMRLVCRKRAGKDN
mmetsp:Transcript_7468/g.20781  ORF Transcript_7468/g.20781 Transcript_7468/m.20781 type:complete len:426 (-) Transcript_7468:1316-2593(-)|eukprot:CAMPEP_0181045156 /NCGR_PEP_ID=MMETSP1070-20121207/13655_1 /TAXON_ID=265543 /ORGANISM="Minutocellus polymorphus, Strain NH13" /LENGTH=425 /DNA_ID=CAMNT_0023123661 /DNA_START=232 /DNA_END=1509 /DNA_ORIENTATION=-